VENDRVCSALELVGVVSGRILAAAHRVAPDELAAMVATVADEAGLRRVRVWLADHEQRTLVPIRGVDGDDSSFGGGAIDIDSSLPGRVFLSSTAIDVASDGRLTVWLPLLDGVDRIGVLQTEVDGTEVSAGAWDVLRALASVTAAEVVSRGQYGDVFIRARRRRGMGVAAEVIWDLLPPPTFATHNVTIAGALEPAYDVGGDAFDYAFNAPTLHFAIFDAVGHGLGSSLLATLAINGYRNARREGAALIETYGRVDRLLAERSPDFVTGHIVELDTMTADLRWVNAGHPPPLLVRRGHIVRTLTSRPRPPLGLGDISDVPVVVATERLEPGDSVLFYTDGVIEARTPAGVDFGMERLTEFVERAEATGMAPPEVVRRLSHAVLDHHQGLLRDDAAIAVIHWDPRPPTSASAGSA
jgi:hypothetical protein